VVKLVIANTTVLRKLTSPLESSVAFVAMLVIWLEIVPTDRRVLIGAMIVQAPVLAAQALPPEESEVAMLSTASTSPSCKNSLAVGQLAMELVPSASKLVQADTTMEPETEAINKISSLGNEDLLVLLLLGNSVVVMIPTAPLLLALGRMVEAVGEIITTITITSNNSTMLLLLAVLLHGSKRPLRLLNTTTATTDILLLLPTETRAMELLQEWLLLLQVWDRSSKVMAVLGIHLLRRRLVMLPHLL